MNLPRLVTLVTKPDKSLFCPFCPFCHRVGNTPAKAVLAELQTKGENYE